MAHMDMLIEDRECAILRECGALRDLRQWSLSGFVVGTDAICIATKMCLIVLAI